MASVFHKVSGYHVTRFRSSSGRFVLMGLGCFALAGCVSAEKIKTGHGIAVPETYVSSRPIEDADPVVMQDWTSDFSSGILDALLAEALINNRDLQIAAARVEEARALAWMEAGAMLPTLTANGSANRSGFRLPDPTGGTTERHSNTYGVSLDLSWELDLWGKLNNRRRAAAFDYRAQEESFRAAQLSLSGQVINGWFGLVEAEEQLRLAEKTEESFVRAERMVRARYEQGLRRALDVRLAASNAASAKALTATRREQVKAASTSLEVLLGRYPSGSLSGDGVLPQLQIAWTDELPSSLLARRPELAASHAAAVAAELRGSAALKDMLPSLRINGSGGYSDGELKDLEDPTNLIWSLAGGIIQPLFQGGALKARADAARARGDQALARYADNLLRAFRDVEIALHAEETLALREAALQVAAEQAQAAEVSASDLYSQGLTGIFELLEAQRRSLNAQSSYLDVRRQRLANRVRLYLSLGGDVPSQEATLALVPSEIVAATPSP